MNHGEVVCRLMSAVDKTKGSHWVQRQRLWRSDLIYHNDSCNYCPSPYGCVDLSISTHKFCYTMRCVRFKNQLTHRWGRFQNVHIGTVSFTMLRVYVSKIAPPIFQINLVLVWFPANIVRSEGMGCTVWLLYWVSQTPHAGYCTGGITVLLTLFIRHGTSRVVCGVSHAKTSAGGSVHR